MQSLQPATHRETSAPSPQAQSAAPQSAANTTAQPVQNQDNDGGNSSDNHSRGEQTRNSNDSTSSQSDQQPTATPNAVVTPAPSPASTSGTIVNLAANNTSGISATAQSASAGTSGAALQVAPAPQTSAQASQPDLSALAITIAAKSQAGAKQFDISLDPPELGRVEVRLTVDSTGNAQAHLVAERPETLQMLQRDSGNLSHALKDSGVQLGDNGLQFSLKGQERQGDSAQQNASRAKPHAVSAISSVEPAGPVPSTYGLALSRAGIDIRV